MSIDVNEATNRQMDRMMASAKSGRQTNRGDVYTEIVVDGPHGEVSIGFGTDDIQAVLDELEVGAACGICHHNPCSWRLSKGES